MTPENPMKINTVTVLGDLDPNSPETELRFENGRTIRVATALLQLKDQSPAAAGDTLEEDETILVPLIEEQLEVGKRTVDTARVHLQKSSETYEVTLDEPLVASAWKVERVPKNEVVAEVPASRQQGNTTIYPLVEERLVLTKELVLIEEVHVTREVSEHRDTRSVILRRETLHVEREPV